MPSSNQNTAWVRNSELLVPNPKLRLRVKDVDFEAQQIIVRGNIQGTFRRWDEQGTLTEEIELKDGQSDGLSKAYFPSGFLKTQVTLQNGKVVDQKFWKDGEYKETASAKPGLVSRKYNRRRPRGHLDLESAGAKSDLQKETKWTRQEGVGVSRPELFHQGHSG